MSPDQILRAALDEPAPPPPAEPVEDHDDGEPRHVHFHMPIPLVAVYHDGGLGIVLNGWTGLLVGVSYVLAMGLVVWLAIQQFAARLLGLDLFALALLGLWVGAWVLLILFVTGLLTSGVLAAWRRWRGRGKAA